MYCQKYYTYKIYNKYKYYIIIIIIIMGDDQKGRVGIRGYIWNTS